MDCWKALKMAVGAVDTETDGFWTFSREIFAFAVDAMVDELMSFKALLSSLCSSRGFAIAHDLMITI